MDLDREFVYLGDGGFTELSGRSRRYDLDLEGRLGIFDASSVVSSPLSVVVSLDESINKQRTTDKQTITPKHSKRRCLMAELRQKEEPSAMGTPWASYPLLDALIERRSRRFGKGMHLDGGPLSYQSERPPQPLAVEEEAALAFAACGITGPLLAELPYQSGDTAESGSGNILIHLAGRTVASGDAVHCGIVFVINDDGVWMLKRPQDFPRLEIADLAQSAREHSFVELYEKSRVPVADQRLDIPRRLPFVPAFNKWSSNLPGTTFFLPVSELSAFYINIMLTAFGEEFSYFLVDDHNGYKPSRSPTWRSRPGSTASSSSMKRAGCL